MVFLGFSFVFFCFSYWPKALLQFVELTYFYEQAEEYSKNRLSPRLNH